MITDIANDAATDAERAILALVDALSDVEMELEDTLEQYDTLMYGDVPLDPEQEEASQAVADLLWDARDLRNEADDLLSRVQDFAQAVVDSRP